jgi:hypothetical protein
MNDQLSNKIQERINAHNIIPLPRWRFLLLRGSFWLLSGLSIIIGSFAVGTTLFLFVDYHRHGLFEIPHDMAEFLSIIPFLWILILILFMVIAEKSIQHTRQGYRYRLRTILVTSIVLSIVLGSVLNYMGIGKITHDYLGRFPLYSSMTYDSREAWSRPTIGRLAGIVLSVRDNTNFSVMDFNGRVWEVRLATSTDDLSAPEASSTVRMLGILDASSNRFIARSVHVWEQ